MSVLARGLTWAEIEKKLGFAANTCRKKYTGIKRAQTTQHDATGNRGAGGSGNTSSTGPVGASLLQPVDAPSCQSSSSASAGKSMPALGTASSTPIISSVGHHRPRSQSVVGEDGGPTKRARLSSSTSSSVAVNESARSTIHSHTRHIEDTTGSLRSPGIAPSSAAPPTSSSSSSSDGSSAASAASLAHLEAQLRQAERFLRAADSCVTVAREQLCQAESRAKDARDTWASAQSQLKAARVRVKDAMRRDTLMCTTDDRLRRAEMIYMPCAHFTCHVCNRSNIVRCTSSSSVAAAAAAERRLRSWTWRPTRGHQLDPAVISRCTPSSSPIASQAGTCL